MSAPARPGALVISIDLELHWGVRDFMAPSDAVVDQLVASRAMVIKLAELFAARDIRATWAIVGMLFAASAAELDRFSPASRPSYLRAELDPYSEAVGHDEDADPLHLAASLITWLTGVPGQEIGSHTFSHYCCLEHGHGDSALRADLAAARAIAEARGITLRSLVLPRNQWRPDLTEVVLESGFDCIRGPQPGWVNRPRRFEETPLVVRNLRRADGYLGGRPPSTFGWGELLGPTGLCNVPASLLLRPWSPGRRALEPLRRARLISGLRQAARRGRIFHLWWHPENFVAHPGPNLEALEGVFEEFDRLASTEGLRSLTMGDVADEARAISGGALDRHDDGSVLPGLPGHSSQDH